jgi:hypothetical protein
MTDPCSGHSTHEPTPHASPQACVIAPFSTPPRPLKGLHDPRPVSVLWVVWVMPQLEEFHKHLQHIDTRLGVQVERMRELNAQEALLGAPMSSVAAISRTQMFLEPFLRLWEVHEVRTWFVLLFTRSSRSPCLPRLASPSIQHTLCSLPPLPPLPPFTGHRRGRRCTPSGRARP